MNAAFYPPICEDDHLALIEAAAADGDFVTFTVDTEDTERRYLERLTASGLHVVERFPHPQAGAITIVVRRS